MKTFEDYILSIKDPIHQEKMREILSWISTNYPYLEKRIAWNSPHFVNEGTFILAVSDAKAHFSLAPEYAAVSKFRDLVEKNGYQATDFIIKIKWNQPIDYDLFKQIIEFNIQDKKGLKTYWR